MFPLKTSQRTSISTAVPRQDAASMAAVMSHTILFF